MDELSRLALKEEERAKLLGKVARVLEVADQENRPLSAIQDAAVMEIVKEAQRLEMESIELSRHQDNQQCGALIVSKESRRVELLGQLAQILENGDLNVKQEAEVMQRIREAQELEADIHELSRGGKHSSKAMENDKSWPICHCKYMIADRVEVSWDEPNNKWLIRIKVGEEVIRRHSEQPPGIDPVTLQTEAVDLTADEGYTVDRASVVIL